MVDRLNAINGISCLRPEGAFYVFPSCKALIGKTTPEGTKLTHDQDVVSYFLESALVAVVQGSAFGAEGYFRISYATSDDALAKALDRIEEAVSKLR